MVSIAERFVVENTRSSVKAVRTTIATGLAVPTTVVSYQQTVRVCRSLRRSSVQQQMISYGHISDYVRRLQVAGYYAKMLTQKLTPAEIAVRAIRSDVRGKAPPLSPDMRDMSEYKFVGIAFISREAIALAPFLPHWYCLDTAHTTSDFDSTMNVITAMDANRSHVYVAVGIYAGPEDEFGWKFTLEQFKAAIPSLPDNVVLCADGGKGIISATATVFPHATVQGCAKHREGNVAEKYGVDISRKIWRIAWACRKTAFVKELAAWDIDVQTYAFKTPCPWALFNLPDVDWATGSGTFGETTSNLAEQTHNSNFVARSLGVLESVVHLTAKHAAKLVANRADILRCEGLVPPRIRSALDESIRGSAKFMASRYGCNSFVAIA
jgi:MULE transposase domain